MKYSVPLLALLAPAALCSPAMAETGGIAEEMKAMQRMMKEQQRLIEEQREQLKRQQAELGKMQRRLDAMSRNTAAAHAEKEKPQPKAEKAQRLAERVKPAPEVGTDRKEIAQEKIPEITVLDSQTGVLLQKGRFVLEPGLEYTNSSATRVDVQGFTIVPALTIGAFQISEVNRDTLTARMTGRLGLTNRLEVDVSVPYLYRNDRTRTRPFGVGATTDTLVNLDGYGLGDIEFGAHYQLNDGREDWPVFIANGRYKSITGTSPFEVPLDPVTGIQRELPTGSGFHAFEPSVTAIVPSDPVVFFGNLGYLFNFERDFGGNIGSIDPGDSVNATAGMSIALNDKTALSFSYNHNMVFESQQNGNTIPQSTLLQIGMLNVGASYKLRDNMSLNFIASAGVTEDAPDVRILCKVPISFNLF